MLYRRLSRLTLTLIFCLIGINAAAETGSVEIYSTPPGLDVYLDGIFVGHTPYNNPDIDVGEHSISVATPDNSTTQTWTFTVDGLTPLAKRFYFEEPQPKKFKGEIQQQAVEEDLGNIQFASTPTGAKVFVNGIEQSTTPVSYLDVPIGRYNVSFELNGKKLEGSFKIEANETGKLIADFNNNQIIDKWREEKSKTSRIQQAAANKEEREIEAEHEKVLKEKLKAYSTSERREILRDRDQVFDIVSIEYMYETNRTYYYNSMKLDEDVVAFYKLPYKKVTLEIKNLKKEESSLIGTYYSGEYVFRYGKHVRRGILNSSHLSSTRFRLYNDTVIKLRYDPDSEGYGKGEGKIFLSIR